MDERGGAPGEGGSPEGGAPAERSRQMGREAVREQRKGREREESSESGLGKAGDRKK